MSSKSVSHIFKILFLTGNININVVQIMKDTGYFNKLYYVTVLYYCGNSHWKCSGLNLVTFVPRAIFKKRTNLWP